MEKRVEQETKRKYLKTRKIILSVLADFKPHPARDVIAAGVGRKAAWQALSRSWKAGVILKSKQPIAEREALFRGRLGTIPHTKMYHLYLLPAPDLLQQWETEQTTCCCVVRSGNRDLEFVPYRVDYADPRHSEATRKSRLILQFLEEHKKEGWFSAEIVHALKDKKVKPYDIMSTIRRAERRGRVYVKGYNTQYGSKPFAKGYLITWIDGEESTSHDSALNEAIQRAERALYAKGGDMPIVERVQRVHDKVVESLHLKTLVPVPSLQTDLRCTDAEIDGAVRRALELFKDIGEARIFGTRYLYHKDLPEDSLKAAIKMKENYTRLAMGKKNRKGHNWEAAAEWYIEQVTSNARFREQWHRSSSNKMDPRRITIPLIKPVGHRIRAAELDRVWTIPSGFGKPLEYVLECKQGLVRKSDLDGFLEVLRWSKEFGTDREDGGRQLKSGIIPLFAGYTFNPSDKVLMRDGTTISLASYAERLNLQILKASVINQYLHERGVPLKVSVQKTCGYARDEEEMRSMLSRMWEKPDEAEAILAQSREKNADIFAREAELEQEEPEEVENGLGEPVRKTVSDVEAAGAPQPEARASVQAPAVLARRQTKIRSSMKIQGKMSARTALESFLSFILAVVVIAAALIVYIS